MFTDYHKGSHYDVPAPISLAAFAHATAHYHHLFDVIDPPTIYRKVDVINDATNNRDSVCGRTQYMICPILLYPEWSNATCNGVLTDAGKVWDHFGGYHIPERDYALLNELKWFLVYKYNTDLKWMGSCGEARIVEALRAFATVLDLVHGEKQSEYAPEDMDDFWDCVEDITDKLFQDDGTRAEPAGPYGANTDGSRDELFQDDEDSSEAFEWDELLDDQWKMMVERVRRKG